MKKKDGTVVLLPSGVEPRLSMGSRYWTVNFGLVFLPFVLLGVPIHALLADFTHPGQNGDPEKAEIKEFPSKSSKDHHHHHHDRERSTAFLLDNLSVDRDGQWRGDRYIEGHQDQNSWRRSLFKGHFSLCFSLILVPFALFVNLGAGYYFYQLFHNLVVLGKIPGEIVQYTIGFVQTLPFLILVDYTWIFGYQIRNRLAYFKYSPMHTEISRAIQRGQLDKKSDGEEGHRGRDLNKYCDEKTWNSILDKTSNCRIKMILMYFIIILIHVIHGWILEYQIKNDSEKWTTEKVIEAWVNYIPTIFLTLMLPAYSCFCWAILFQLQILTGFIDGLVIQRKLKRMAQGHKVIDDGEDPPLLKRELLSLFKSSYGQIADSILQVNRHFALYMSFVLICLGISIYLEVQQVVFFFIREFLKKATIGEETRREVEQVLKPGIVRTFVGQFTKLLMYLLLVILTLWQVVGVNDEARAFHVALNDLASESGLQKRDEVQADQYNQDFHLVQTFRLIKLYVHSRMELEEPALLNITLLFLFPGLKARFTNYRVLH